MNTIEKFKQNAPQLLDAVYKAAAKTAILDTEEELVQAGANANEIIIPMIDMDGLGDYSRNSGYTDGDVKLTNQTVPFDYERGRKLKVDRIDNEETAGIAFGKLSGEFVRTKVVPEVDAMRFAKYSSLNDITKLAPVTYTKGEEILEAIQDTYSQMTEDEVGESERFLFITPTLHKKAKHVSKITNTDILDNFAAVIEVPQSRFYTKIQLLNGKDSGEEKGGYKPASDGKKINFMIIHKPAVLQYAKHANIKIFTADQDQDGDFNKMLYRIYSLENGYKNKRAGFALSHQA